MVLSLNKEKLEPGKGKLKKIENERPLQNRKASTVKDGVIFQAKANEKGKQSNEQTLAQMKEIGTKRLRGKEVSNEENTRAQKCFCETVFSGLADSVIEPV